MVPGADWAFTIGAGLRGHSVVPAVGGIVLGYAGLTVVVAAGVGALVARSPAVLSVLTIVGGFYLMWHGATTLARPSAPDAPASNSTPASKRAPARTSQATLLRGAGVSALNPKGLLLFLALLPQFTNPHGSWPLAVQLIVLGLVFMLSCGAFYLCLGSVARKTLHARPAAARAVTRFSGAAMFVIGAFLLADRLIAR